MNVDIAYLDSSNWGEREMRERTCWLRQNDPVHWSEPDQLWVVTRYADVAACSKNQQVFTSAEGVRAGNLVKIGLIDEGEPRHGKLRGLINKGFTPRMVAKLEIVFRKITTEAIDAVAQRGECDFVEDIAVPLPLRLIAAMIGIREADYERFHHWSDSMIAADGNYGNPAVMAEAGRSYMEYATYVTEIIEERRRSPRDDLVSILTGAKDQGLLVHYDEAEVRPDATGAIEVELGNDELIKLLVILLVAGNETTRNALSGGAAQLIENPDQRQRILDDPTLLKGAVEEMLRIVSPVHSFSRMITQDAELGDQKLEKGQRILMIYPSANHDEREFSDPERFDITRNPAHLAFGVGNHFCLGSNLARMEMRVAFEELLRRLPDMEYSGGGPVLRPSALVRTCSEMKLRFTPEEGVPA